MKRHFAAVLALTTASFHGLMCLGQEQKGPPVTRIDNVTEALHGVTISDPYRLFVLAAWDQGEIR